jgi:hypothetical protein
MIRAGKSPVPAFGGEDGIAEEVMVSLPLDGLPAFGLR